MRSYRAGTRVVLQGARKGQETKARKKLLAQMKKEEREAEEWERLIQANYHILTPDGEPVEY